LKQIAELLRAQLTDALTQRDKWQEQARLAALPPRATPRTSRDMSWRERVRWLRATG